MIKISEIKIIDIRENMKFSKKLIYIVECYAVPKDWREKTIEIKTREIEVYGIITFNNFLKRVANQTIAFDECSVVYQNLIKK
ncbi:MAG: hypothetical protein ABH811_00035 [archaeon]